jgi:hypothetical protein
MSPSFERNAQAAIRRRAVRAHEVSDDTARNFSPSVRQIPLAIRHSTADAIRRSSLLQYQHSPGNACVQRVIATTAIMRCGCVPGEACSCGRGGADAEPERKEGSR